MNRLSACFALSFVSFLAACSGGGGKDADTGTITGTVTRASDGAGLGNIRIVVFEAATNSPMGGAITTSANGNYSASLDPGTYYLRFSGQGYLDVPDKSVAPLPIPVAADSESVYDVEMTTNGLTSIGWIHGRVVEGSTGVAGVLVVSSDGVNAYSAITDASGYYDIFNVPPGTYTVTVFTSGRNATPVMNVIVTANQQTTAANVVVTSGATGVVTGQVSFLATTAVPVDVALVHPITKESIPGVSVLVDTAGGTNYTITGVPNGTYFARASFGNDGRVIDPDYIVKFGEPNVTVNSDTVELDFSLTGSVTLNSPTNPAESTSPLVIPDSLPRFSWTAYPSSTGGYVVEVTNANGAVIWGGFTNQTRNFNIPDDSTAINYNFNGTASAALLPGKTYRWRIYAAKNVAGGSDTTGWGYKLISVSEEQRGLIKIAE